MAFSLLLFRSLLQYGYDPGSLPSQDSGSHPP
ncbi:MAG: outer membrane protein assembly factor BamE, partial [Gammaproteobacteria bacterium HGW-Gammaproteobacteria-6]